VFLCMSVRLSSLHAESFPCVCVCACVCVCVLALCTCFSVRTSRVCVKRTEPVIKACAHIFCVGIKRAREEDGALPMGSPAAEQQSSKAVKTEPQETAGAAAAAAQVPGAAGGQPQGAAAGPSGAPAAAASASAVADGADPAAAAAAAAAAAPGGAAGQHQGAPRSGGGGTDSTAEEGSGWRMPASLQVGALQGFKMFDPKELRGYHLKRTCSHAADHMHANSSGRCCEKLLRIVLPDFQLLRLRLRLPNCARAVCKANRGLLPRMHSCVFYKE